MLTVVEGGAGGKFTKTEMLTLGGLNFIKNRGFVSFVEYKKSVYFCCLKGTIDFLCKLKSKPKKIWD